jgi:spoIIIJ-associated protein
MNKKELIESLLNDILGYIKINPIVNVIEEEESYFVDITGNNLNFLIGYRGESLYGLQTIVNHMLFSKTGEWVHAVVDVNGYRKSKLEKIEEITKSNIDRVRFLNEAIELPVMNPFERRHVHMFVAGYEDIASESKGEDPYRKIVLMPADLANDSSAEEKSMENSEIAEE